MYGVGTVFMNESANKSLHGVGRRKSSVARVWLKPGKGTITVNDREFKEYFACEMSRYIAQRPFFAANINAKFDAVIKISGGGEKSQAGAAALGISRAMLVFDETLRSVLKKHKLLTVDSRVKERKKPGQKAARAKFQFVKR
jgi:small subunit ribosomal protein S9